MENTVSIDDRLTALEPPTDRMWTELKRIVASAKDLGKQNDAKIIVFRPTDDEVKRDVTLTVWQLRIVQGGKVRFYLGRTIDSVVQQAENAMRTGIM